MKEFMLGAALVVLIASNVFNAVLYYENKSLRHRNMNLVDKITEIQSDQSKMELIEQNALRRKVRKIAAKEAAK